VAVVCCSFGEGSASFGNAPARGGGDLAPGDDAPAGLDGNLAWLGLGLALLRSGSAQLGIDLARGSDAPAKLDDGSSEGGDGPAQLDNSSAELDNSLGPAWLEARYDPSSQCAQKVLPWLSVALI
jgi:hypothetical protein